MMYTMKTIKELANFHKCDKVADTHHSYDKPYEFHFAPFRNKPVTLLEIGVGGYDNPVEGGASLRMWDEYFTHPDRKIYSFDHFLKKGLETERIKIFKGDQNDVSFLTSLAFEMDELDIIIDDGSHVNSDVIISFKTLFPMLNEGGIYVVEDVQTSYWHHYGGQISGEWGDQWITTMNYFKERSDGLNFKEIATEQRDKGIIPNEPNYFDLNITSIHFYHNIIFIYKGDNSVTA